MKTLPIQSYQWSLKHMHSMLAVVHKIYGYKYGTLTHAMSNTCSQDMYKWLICEESRSRDENRAAT